MDITSYLEKHKMTRRQFAHLIDVHEGEVSYYVTGYRVPRERTALKIQKKTKGEIKVADLRGKNNEKVKRWHKRKAFKPKD